METDSFLKAVARKGAVPEQLDYEAEQAAKLDAFDRRNFHRKKTNQYQIRK